jgi:hypothetical protein
MSAEEADYLKRNYGACDAEPCPCRKAGRTLLDCEHWHPVAANTWAELEAEMREHGGMAWLPGYGFP